MIDDLAIRLEYYRDREPKKPEAWQAFIENWSERDPVEEGYTTVVLDSVTFMNLRVMHYAQFRKLKHAKDPRKWYGLATEELEQQLMGKFSALDCNLVVTAHVSREKDEAHGDMVYFPSAPGRLGPKGGGLPSAFAETYRSYCDDDKKGTFWALQTEKDSRFNACTAINAPDSCEPEYAALWQNWKGERPPIHVLVYGDAGSKKSVLAASFPQPILVCMFDPAGKHFPYLRVGEPQPVKFNKSMGIYTQNVLR